MPAESRLVLVPIGPVNPGLLPWLGRGLAALFGRPPSIAPEASLSEAWYDRRRQQYRSDEVLAWLRARADPAAWRVLGIVEADLYTRGLNFLFGQASLSGRVALIALARLHPSFYGQAEDEGRFRERVLKEAVHELGHTLGLGHCRDRHCVMHFSNTLADTDLKGADFCPACARRVAQGG